MHFLDYSAVALFFIAMIIIGFYSFNKIKSSEDFFVAGGKVPWWLSGISHHVSGYSGVVFVAYAAIAYKYGLTLYFWWGFNIAIAVILGSIFIVPRWPRLRQKLNIQSPTEYLKLRYNTSAQQIIAWSGVVVKLFDVAAKWASMGILLHGFTGLPIWLGIVVSGGVSLLYIAVGGLWADLWTDFAQFVVQIVAGLVLFISTIMYLGGVSALFDIWDKLPKANSQMFNGPYTAAWTFGFFFVILLSYTGGTWNLAARFISTPNSVQAKKSAYVSAVLYLVWPLILFFPMWAGPIIFPGLEDPAANLYPMLTKEFLPPGLVGLVLASMFANTMSMTTSDANTISAVITRDILPNLYKQFRNLSQRASLKLARNSTIVFTVLTMIIAVNKDAFGDVIGLILTWFGALLGPTAIPMILGLFPTFKHCDSRAAIISILGGLITFAVINYSGIVFPQSIKTVLPLIIAFVLYSGIGLINKSKNDKVSDEIEDLLDYLSKPEDISAGVGISN
ncbi:MAG: solute:Na+ symporter, family [Clostridiales bacterium]|nr:solute:Na+ symporter, family [Clostridiales bacterium]